MRDIDYYWIIEEGHFDKLTKRWMWGRVGTMRYETSREALNGIDRLVATFSLLQERDEGMPTAFRPKSVREVAYTPIEVKL